MLVKYLPCISFNVLKDQFQLGEKEGQLWGPKDEVGSEIECAKDSSEDVIGKVSSKNYL